MATHGASAAESKLSANAAEFVPQGNYSFASQSTNTVSNGENVAIAVTDAAMLKLLNNPETIYEVVNPLVVRLSTLITDTTTLEAVIEHIFQRSIFQANYQYTGARLCTILAEKLKLTFSNGGFRDVLFRRCREEFEKRDELSKSDIGLEELAGYTLFFAEVILNIKIDGLLDKFADQFFALLLVLLSTVNDTSIRCVNKVLKLIGATLDSTDRGKMDGIFARIKDVVVQSNTSKQIRVILVTLISLRAQRWGLDSETTTAASAVENGNSETLPDSEIHDENGELVYDDYEGETEGYDYGGYPDYVANGYVTGGFESGVITEENYEAWVPEEENIEFGGIPCIIGNDEMDPEMEEAYEQFLEQLKPPSSAETSDK